MPRRTTRIPLSHGSPGTSRSILVHKFGPPQAERKAYLQAALHSDETPGLLTLHSLLEMLEEAENQDRILGEILVVPFANPIGLNQFVHRRHSGSGELAGGGNFNRNWPDLTDEIAKDIGHELGDDPIANQALIRKASLRAVETRATDCEFDALRNSLLALALGCDLVLDLHCDTGDALVHIFTHKEFASDLEGLFAYLGCRSVFLEQTIGSTFQDSCAAPWLRLTQAYPNKPIPRGCVSATVELRGQSDVNAELAERDARALFSSLQREGFISGQLEPLPAPLCAPTPDNTFEVLRAPITGVLSYAVSLGDSVKTGDLVAWIIDLDAENPAAAKVPVRAGTNGFVLATNLMKYAMAGWSIGKISGSRPLSEDQTIEGGGFYPA